MNGLKITTPYIFTDRTLPVLTPDGNIIPGAADDIVSNYGALFLADPGNPYTTDFGFINVAAGSIRNLAAARAAVTVGSGSETTLAGVTAKLFATNAGLVELSGKKGIHVINSQTVSASNNGFKIELPDLIKTYILANLGHTYYVAYWGKTTKVATPVSSQYSSSGIANVNNANTSRVYLHKPNSTDVASSGGVTNQGGNDVTLGVFSRSVAGIGWGGTLPTSIADIRAYVQVGSKDVYGGPTVNHAPSQIIYKFYVEDLTVSGRSFATVDAINTALYTQDVLTPGGRYYGDTNTSPSTIA